MKYIVQYVVYVSQVSGMDDARNQEDDYWSTMWQMTKDMPRAEFEALHTSSSDTWDQD